MKSKERGQRRTRSSSASLCVYEGLTCFYMCLYTHRGEAASLISQLQNFALPPRLPTLLLCAAIAHHAVLLIGQQVEVDYLHALLLLPPH